MPNLSNIKISSIKFTFLFTLFVFIANNAIIIEKFTKWFITKGDLDIIGLIAYLLVGYFLSVALIVTFSHKYIIKPFAFFVLFSATSSAYFISKYNIAIDKSMILNIWHTNPTESFTLFSAQMIPYFLFLVIIPMYIIAKIEITFDTPLKHILKTFGAFMLAFILAVAFIYAKFNSIHLAGNRSKRYIMYHTIPANFIYTIEANIGLYLQKEYFPKVKKKKVEIKGKITKKEDIVVVLAIGEAARQKSLSLYGYEKNTNPLLSQIDGIHTLNGIAKYGSTIYAIPTILSKDDIKLPSISSYLGIETTCYSNFQNYGNCGTVEEVMVSNCKHEEGCYDEDVIPLLENDLKSYKSGQKLVVLHIGAGSHGPLYYTRHPKEFQKFNPQCRSADVMNECTKDELYNSYDNTILYTDYVVANLINTLENSKVPYVFMYLSDHGESLLEEGRVFHGMPPGIDLPYEQAHIPLLVKASIPIKIIKKDEYKQPYLYDTILDLLNIDTELLDKKNIFIKKQ